MAVGWCGPSACVCVSSCGAHNLFFFFYILPMCFPSGNLKIVVTSALGHALFIRLLLLSFFLKIQTNWVVASVLNFCDCSPPQALAGCAGRSVGCVCVCEIALQTLGERLEGLQLQLCGLHRERKRGERKKKLIWTICVRTPRPQRTPPTPTPHPASFRGHALPRVCTCAECTAVQQVTANISFLARSSSCNVRGSSLPKEIDSSILLYHFCIRKAWLRASTMLFQREHFKEEGRGLFFFCFAHSPPLKRATGPNIQIHELQPSKKKQQQQQRQRAQLRSGQVGRSGG